MKSSLTGYLVTKLERMEVASGLTLEQVHLLLPQEGGKPVILTRHPALVTGDYLKTVGFDGYLIDGRLLGIPADLVSRHGPRVIVADPTRLSYEKGIPSIPAPAPPPTPTAAPTPGPTPTITPTATLYSLLLSASPSSGGSVSLTPPGGTYQAGATVVVSATAAPGYVFDRWGGDASGNASSITIVTDRNKSVTAYFKRIFP